MLSHLIKFLQNRQCLAVGAVFLAMGMLFGNWATLIPSVKYKYSLDDGQLGLLILCLPVGGAVANPISTWFIHRYGMQRMTLVGLIGMCFCFILPVSVDLISLVAIGLFLTGMFLSFTNVSMNTCASALEYQLKEYLMSTCHGLFSLGLMLGSLYASALIGLNARPTTQTVMLSLMIAFLGWMIRRIILGFKDDHHENITSEKPTFSFPRGPLLIMILVAMCTNLTEGSMADWTAVYLRDIVQAPAYLLGWGLASYSFFMAIGRFFGDYIIPKYGANHVLKYGGLLSALGIALAVFIPVTMVCIVAFGLVGLGVSCGAPIMYGAAAKLPDLAKGVGLATLNTFSVTAFLGGPVIIGFVSNALDLQVALALVSLVGLVWVYFSTKINL